MTRRSAIKPPTPIQIPASKRAARTTRVSIRAKSLQKRESVNGRLTGGFSVRSMFEAG